LTYELRKPFVYRSLIKYFPDAGNRFSVLPVVDFVIITSAKLAFITYTADIAVYNSD
jgi:hypothetical protein